MELAKQNNFMSPEEISNRISDSSYDKNKEYSDNNVNEGEGDE